MERLKSFICLHYDEWLSRGTISAPFIFYFHNKPPEGVKFENKKMGNYVWKNTEFERYAR